MQYLAVLNIVILYFLIAFIRPYLKVKICAICAAVSLTWAIFTLLWLIDFDVPVVLLAILMGMSLTGLMYSIEKFFQRKKLRNFWFVRIVIIAFGFLIISSFLNSEYNKFVLFFVLAVVLCALATLFFQNDNREPGPGIKRLEDCC